MNKSPMIQGRQVPPFPKGKYGLLGCAFTSKNLATGVTYSLFAPTKEELSKIVAHLFPDQQADESRFQYVEVCKGPTP